jgi:hypothetical protein
VLAATALFGSYNDSVVTALAKVGKGVADAVQAYRSCPRTRSSA